MKSFIVTGNPPTPNGDLHVGHLSGPYLGADVFTRYQRMQGNRVAYLSFSDDHQSFVVTSAIRTGRDPVELLQQAARKIKSTLRAANIEVDMYLLAHGNQQYIEIVRSFFKQMYDEGLLKEKTAQMLYCDNCSRHLFESYVSGKCPFCGEDSVGNLCEACGRVNDPVDLGNPVCTICRAAPSTKEYRGLFFPLEKYRSAMAAFYASRTSWRPHQMALCEWLVSKEIPDYPASYPTDWGIPVPVAGYEGQTINAWFEMYAGHYATMYAWSRLQNDPGLLDQLRNGETQLVQFCGFDNTSCNAILHAALSLATGGRYTTPAHVMTNEFYLLDGRKFSTSQNHAIWGGDILQSVQADSLRYYVSRTNPEHVQSSFSYPEFGKQVELDLVRVWNNLVNDFLQRAHSDFEGVIPAEPDIDLKAVGLLTWCKNWLERFYDLEEFSLRQASAILHSYAEGCADYLNRMVVPVAGQPEYRQRMASLAYLIKGFAHFAAPLLPDFAQRLWVTLGLAGQVQKQGWAEATKAFANDSPAGPIQEWFANVPGERVAAKGI